MPGSGECLKQKHQFLNFWGKTIWGKMANMQSQNGRRDYRSSLICKRGLLLMGTYAHKSEGGWKIGHKIRMH